MIRQLQRLAAACALMLVPSWAAAQGGATISGHVTGDGGIPLANANVFLEGMNLGAITNEEGSYSFTVPAARFSGRPVTLTARLIGYRESSAPITLAAGTITHDFALEANAVELQGMVVTALGVEQEQRSLGYAVQKVEGAEVAQAGEPNLVTALAGKAAGVSVISSSGRPGASSRIVIRGESSFLGNSQPLFIVDGVPISNAVDGVPDFTLDHGNASNRALDIDPNNIAEISVLRGAGATALYGSRAANGAIVITTKRGSGAPKVSVSSSMQRDTPILEGYQSVYLQGDSGYFTNGLPLDRGGYMQPGFPGTNPQLNLSWGPRYDQVDPEVLQALGVGSIPVHDPREEFYRDGTLFQNAVSVSGGLSSGSYYLGLTHTNQDGIAPSTSLRRLNVSGSFSTTLGSRLSSTTNLMIVQNDNDWLDEGWNGPTRYLAMTPISFDQSQPFFDDGTPHMLSGSTPNASWLTRNTGYASDVSRLTGGQVLALTLTQHLTISNRLGLDSYTDQRDYHVNQQPWSVERGVPSGRVWNQKIVNREVNNDLMLNLNDVSLGHDLVLSGLLGSNVNVRDYSYGRIFGSDINIPDFYSIGNFDQVTADQYKQRQRLLGAYAEATLGYRDYLFLKLDGRNDWSSTLPVDHNSYFYPAASLSYVFTDALHIESSWLDYGKLRMSWARVGNAASPYSLRTGFSQSGYTDFAGPAISLDYPFNGVNGYTLSSRLGNPDLKPELTTEKEVGLELRLLQGRVSTELTYYDRSSRDQIFAVPASDATGYGTILRNAGALRNRGVELSIGATPIQTESFSWNVRANYSRNRSSVISLAPGVESIYLAGYSYPQIRIMKDEGYGVIWGFGYERNENGQILVSDDGMPVVSDQLSALGNIQPDWLGNVHSTFTFRSLSLSGLLDIRQGGDILNDNLYYTIPNGTAKITEQRNDQYVWQGVNANTGQPNTTAVTRDRSYWRAYALVQENLIEEGSSIRLRELTLSYKLPSSLLDRIGASAMSLYLTGRNLWIDTPFSQGDPEGNTVGSNNAGGSAFYFFPAPSTRSYGVGMRVTF